MSCHIMYVTHIYICISHYVNYCKLYMYIYMYITYHYISVFIDLKPALDCSIFLGVEASLFSGKSKGTCGTCVTWHVQVRQRWETRWNKACRMPQLMASDRVDLGCFVMLCALCCDGSARSPCFSSSSCSMVLAMWIHFPSPCHPGNKHAMPCQAHILLKKSEKKLEMNEMIQNAFWIHPSSHYLLAPSLQPAWSFEMSSFAWNP